MSDFGDLVIDEAVRNGQSLIITKAHVATVAEKRFIAKEESKVIRDIRLVRWASEPILTLLLGGTGGLIIFGATAEEKEIDEPDPEEPLEMGLDLTVFAAEQADLVIAE